MLPHPHPLGSALGARPGPRLVAGITLKRPLTPLVLDSPAWGEGGRAEGGELGSRGEGRLP